MQFSDYLLAFQPSRNEFLQPAGVQPFERLVHFGIMESNLRTPLNTTENMVAKGLKGALDLASIITRGDSISGGKGRKSRRANREHSL